jgi:hypothetical protein
MAKPRSPTLKQIAGKRPRCQYCDKELKPVTCTVEVVEHLTTLPTADELLGMSQPNPTWPTTSIAVERGYQPEFVFRMTHKADLHRQSYTVLHFWTGKDHGYGYTDTPKLFCNNAYGRLFGLAAWRAGYRLKGPLP